jgi:hypothetical protein
MAKPAKRNLARSALAIGGALLWGVLEFIALQRSRRLLPPWR